MTEYDGIVVVGAGLVGAMAALTLRKRGYKVMIFEKMPDWRNHFREPHSNEEKKAGEKALKQEKSAIRRSINLALSRRGQEALSNVGLLEKAMKITVPMRCRAIHTKRTDDPHPDRFQRYDEIDDHNYINSISREELNLLLLDELENLGVAVYFEHALGTIRKQGTAVISRKDKQPLEIKPRLILGCDGAYSSTRAALERIISTNLTRFYISHGYKELHMPPDPGTNGFALETPEALHIWPRGDFMMIGLPNPDKTFTCTIFAPFKTQGEIPGILDLEEPKEIEEYFKEYFPDVTKVIPDYVEQFKRNPACRLVTISTSPWNWEDKILLLGDAAHACVPFYGQGMNCGFEDVLELDETIRACENNLSVAVPRFAQTRQPRGEAIGELSLRNYAEMRERTASSLFLFRKKVEGWLNYLFPRSWIPLYKMVTFTRIPYDEVIKRSAIQDVVLDALVASVLMVAPIGLTFIGKQIAAINKPN